MFCLKCKKESPASHKFCAECGTKLPARPSENAVLSQLKKVKAFKARNDRQRFLAGSLAYVLHWCLYGGDDLSPQSLLEGLEKEGSKW